MSSDSDDTQPPLADTHGSSAPLASRKRPLTTKDEETGLDVWLECKEGSIEEVDEALEQGVDLNIADPDPLGFTLLMVCKIKLLYPNYISLLVPFSRIQL